MRVYARFQVHVFYVHLKFEVGPGGMRGSTTDHFHMPCDSLLDLLWPGGMRGMTEVRDAFINRMASNGKLVQ